MAAVRHLGFVVRLWGTTHEGHLVVLITVQNLVGIDAVVFKNMHVFRFREFGLKNAYSRPKIGVFWGF